MEPKCQRCDRGLIATHLCYSEVLRIEVCQLCVLEALTLPMKGAGSAYEDDAVYVHPIGREIDPR